MLVHTSTCGMRSNICLFCLFFFSLPFQFYFHSKRHCGNVIFGCEITGDRVVLMRFDIEIHTGLPCKLTVKWRRLKSIASDQFWAVSNRNSIHIGCAENGI